MNDTNKGAGSNNKILLRFAGLTTQILISIGVAMFIGLKADKWLSLKTPLLVWLLPLLVLGVIIYQIIKETSKK